MNKMDWAVPQRGIFTVKPADACFDLFTQRLIFLDASARRHAHEYKPDCIDGFQSGQETVDGFQSMQDTLSVVHPLHGYDESFALVSEMKLLTPTMEFGRIKCFFKLNCVDPDRIHAQGGAMPVAADMRELRFNPQKALHGVAEMTQVMQQRPDARVRKTFVMRLDILFTEKHRHAAIFFCQNALDLPLP